MRALSGVFLLLGYVLVYAATAAGGVFATDPWAGLYADAYTASSQVGLALRGGTVNPGPRKR